MNTINLIGLESYQFEMINLRRISLISNLSFACVTSIKAFVGKNHGLAIKNLMLFSTHKQLSQADAEHLKSLKEEARFYYQAQQYEQGRKVSQIIAEFLLKKGQMNTYYADNYTNAGLSYKVQRKLPEALKFLTKAINFLDSLQGNFKVQKAVVQRHIGEVYYDQQDYEQAERCLTECAQILKHSPQTFQLCCTLGLLAMINKQKKQYEAAIGLFETQLAILQKFQEIKGRYAIKVLDSLVELSACFFLLEKYPQALVVCQKAMQLFESEGVEKSKQFAFNLLSMGCIYKALNQKQQYFHHIEKALAISQQILGKDHPELLCILSELGMQYYFSEQPDQAFPLLQRYLLVFTTSGSKEDKIQMYANIVFAVALIHRKNQNCTEALKHYQQCLEIYQKSDAHQERVALIFKQMAETHYHLQDFKSSLDCAMRSLVVHNKINGQSSPKNAEILLIIATIFQEMGKQSQSLAFIKFTKFVMNNQANAAKK